MNNNEVNTMFCRQCQETFGNSGCTMVGVCGKRPVTAGLMDELVARLEDLARVYKPTLGFSDGHAQARIVEVRVRQRHEERARHESPEIPRRLLLRREVLESRHELVHEHRSRGTLPADA